MLRDEASGGLWWLECDRGVSAADDVIVVEVDVNDGVHLL